MTYQPKPVDTSRVRLDPKLADLTEFLAANTHEVWASGRIGQGWRYGTTRDDASLRHPDLVPYAELTDAEKQFDRDTAMQTLKLIVARGYHIVPPADGSERVPAPAGFAEFDLKRLGVAEILQLWKSLDAKSAAAAPPEVFQGVARRALNLGEPLLAFDVLKTALKQYPAHVALRQAQAVALSRSGVVEEATRRLKELLAEGHEDEETLGNLASTLKTRWELATDRSETRRLLEEAFASYETAYRHPKGGYWTGINAATLAACLGLQQRAESLAREVEADCSKLLDRGGAGDENLYWELATLGEAALVRRDFAAAERLYARAVKAAGDQFGLIASTRRNAQHLLRQFSAYASLLDRWLPMPRVVVFTGHMIDRPGRAVPRFPVELENAVAEEIRKRVEALDVRVGYASAACGADILFHEAVAARGGEVNVVLPYELERFMRDSVCLEPGSTWEARFRELLDRKQTRLIVASQGNLQDVGVSNEYANQFSFGLAGIRASRMRTQLAALAVWDGKAGDGPGGTAGAIARWRDSGIEPSIIDLRDILERERPELAQVMQKPPAPDRDPGDSIGGRAEVTTHMSALLFADVVGFSKLSEDEMPLFVEHFLKPVASLCEKGEHGCPSPVQRNTWGDGLYFVFENVHDAGQFALELRDRVTKTDWLALGFRKQLSLRTGLHVGPVYRCRNPITGREDYLGTHVSRAARIEPITPKGEVYASEVFAAIAFAEGVEAFTCEYVGQIGLAKEFGTYPTYHVRRRR
jgi:class 3 adenylate cyclase/tetratricopeptide (TPR) repeat protein